MTAANSSAYPWRIIVPIVLIGAVVLLMGLPLGAVFIANKFGCCFANGPENVVTFWAALTAGFLALFGMLVTGVFVITSIRTDATARAEAHNALETYIKRNREEFLKDLDESRKKVKSEAAAASKEITGAQREIETQQDKAGNAIASAQKAVVGTAKEAQQKIGAALEGANGRRDEAIHAIDRVQAEVESAAKDAQERIDQAARSLSPPEEDPKSPDA